MIWQSLVDLGAIAAIPALVLSIITYYYLYLKSGKIEIYMPDEVGLYLIQSPRLHVYATFSNDGSPNTWKIIKNINTTCWIHRKDKPDEEIKFDWRYVYRPVGIEDYERNYKKPNETISNDAKYYSVFESVRAPFTVPGKGTVTKLFVFISSKKIPNFSEPFTFEVEIQVTTMDNKIYSSNKTSYYGTNVDAVKITTQRILLWFPRVK